ncbi:hypothetical protein ACL02U_02480 [Streptomyces sp. MS06]|uniref:hypothetical protein n=1 Tax=Streptomyces sp. MS06 TaxID=3385974 RepID=UPI0039A28F28
MLANEVKLYQRYSTVTREVGGVEQRYALQREVPLSPHIEEQINKDVYLRATVRGFDPRWSFMNASPSQELRDRLEQAGIIYLEYGN